MQTDTPIRILLVDDQPLFRRAIATLIDEQPDMVVVGEAENGLDGVEQARALDPDLVVMDVEMPVMNGVEAVGLLQDQAPRAKVVMLTVSDSEDFLFDALRNGADGYLLKDLRPDQLYDMLRAVMRDESPISPVVAGRLLKELRGHDAVRNPAPERAGRPGPDPARDRDPPARRRRALQQGDRDDPHHHRGDRQEPRPQRPREAPSREPDPGRGLRGPAGHGPPAGGLMTAVLTAACGPTDTPRV